MLAEHFNRVFDLALHSFFGADRDHGHINGGVFRLSPNSVFNDFGAPGIRHVDGSDREIVVRELVGFCIHGDDAKEGDGNKC